MVIRPPIRPTPGSSSSLPSTDARAPFAMKSVQQAGAEAFLLKLPTASCRFPLGSGQNIEWVRGWAAEQIRQRGIEADETLGALGAPEAADAVRDLLVPRAAAARDAARPAPGPIAPEVADLTDQLHGALALD